MRRTPEYSQLVASIYKSAMLDIPTAKVRSVGDVHDMERGGLPLVLEVRDGDSRRVGPDAVKETVLEVGHMKRVSMPSELFLEAGADPERNEGRAGSVNERRAAVETCGACSRAFKDAGTDMMCSSCVHFLTDSKSGESRCRPGMVSVCVQLRSRSVCQGLWLEGVSVSRCLARLAVEFQMDQRITSTPRSAFAFSIDEQLLRQGFTGMLRFFVYGRTNNTPASTLARTYLPTSCCAWSHMQAHQFAASTLAMSV